MKKKEYIQPAVELTKLMANSFILIGSPETGISGGGNTGGIGGGTDPIPGE